MRVIRVGATVALLGYSHVDAYTLSLSISQGLDHRSVSDLSMSARPVSLLGSKGDERRSMVLKATEDGNEDILESYKRQMAEFMVQSHEKRLEAMDAVKVEVQRGYEEQIAELRAQLATLPSTSATPAAAAVPAPKRTEELAIVGSASEATNLIERSDAVNLHPAYAARTGRPGWEARWGTEEVERVAAVSSTVKPPTSDSSSPSAEAVGSAIHPSYAARFERPGWSARWGDAEVARVNAANTVNEVQDAPHVPDNAHPAYTARLLRPGWQERWGVEEHERVANAAAGVIATEGPAAGVATAGGLEARAAEDATEQVSSTMDEFLDWSLPDDVSELKEMVLSSRRHFQDYLVRALEANNELRASKTALEKDLASMTAELSKAEELPGALRSKSEDPQDTIETDVGMELKNRVLSLTEEVAQLQRFAQEYMVKAASEKLKAVEETRVSTQQESSERIAALQAQILALQAQG